VLAVGQPYVKGASVTAVIEQLTLVSASASPPECDKSCSIPDACTAGSCGPQMIRYPGPQAPKVYIFKKRRRKNSRRLRGFRAAVTSLRIRSITPP